MTNFFYLIKLLNKLLKYNCLFVLNRLFFIKILKLFYFPYRVCYRKLPLGQRLSKAIVELGPSFIKIGQVLSVRTDILGEEIASHLSSLQDKVKPFAFEQAKKIIEESFGKKLDELFASFEKTPIASASIAQVHLATDFYGNKLAVKILRPDIEKTFAKDLKFLYFANSILKKIKKKEDFKVVLDDISRVIKTELNLNLEAASADKLKENLKKETFVKIPNVYWEKTSAKVLTLEYIEATSIKNIDKNNKLLVEDVLKKLSSMLFLQAFRDGFYHGDLHPGNVHIDKNGNVVLFDFGVIGYLSDHNRKFLAKMWIGFLEKDYHKVAKLHFEGGFIHENENFHAFETAIRYIGEGILAKSMNNFSGARVILELVKISKDFNLPINTQLMLLQKNMFYLEGMAKNLGFTGNFWGLSKTAMKDWARQNLSIRAKLKERVQEFSNNINSINETIYYAKKYYKSGVDGRKNTVILKSKNKSFLIFLLLITNFALIAYILLYGNS